MFKVKTISRLEHDFLGKSDDVIKTQKNPDPALHPFAEQREYMRALRAAKVNKMFAKPFVFSLEGHSDSINCMATSPTSLITLATGACDGELKLWNIASRSTFWSAQQAHTGFVRGVSISFDGQNVISCGDDCLIKLWSVGSKVSSSKPKISSIFRDGNDNENEEDAKDAESKKRLKEIKARKRRRLASVLLDNDDESSDGAGGDDDEDGEGNDGNDDGMGIGGLDDLESQLISKESSSTTIQTRSKKPSSIFTTTSAVHGVDFHWSDYSFASCGAEVCVWDINRSEPMHKYSWGADYVKGVRFNPSEKSLIGGVGSDRSITLYDVRSSSPLKKTILAMNSNSIAWNPMEPLNFAVANEDHNIYTFDMRKLDQASSIYRDHVSAVMDVHYSPTGREFVSAGWDRTIRIFRTRDKRSRDVYHTNRMQRVFAVRFTGDAKFVISGSEDTNIRVWKSQPSDPLRRLGSQEKRHKEYSKKLLDKYGHLDEIRKIQNFRHLPKEIKSAKRKEREMKRPKIRDEKKAVAVIQ